MVVKFSLSELKSSGNHHVSSTEVRRRVIECSDDNSIGVTIFKTGFSGFVVSFICLPSDFRIVYYLPTLELTGWKKQRWAVYDIVPWNKRNLCRTGLC